MKGKLNIEHLIKTLFAIIFFWIIFYFILYEQHKMVFFVFAILWPIYYLVACKIERSSIKEIINKETCKITIYYCKFEIVEVTRTYDIKELEYIYKPDMSGHFLIYVVKLYKDNKYVIRIAGNSKRKKEYLDNLVDQLKECGIRERITDKKR